MFLLLFNITIFHITILFNPIFRINYQMLIYIIYRYDYNYNIKRAKQFIPCLNLN